MNKFALTAFLNRFYASLPIFDKHINSPVEKPSVFATFPPLISSLPHTLTTLLLIVLAALAMQHFLLLFAPMQLLPPEGVEGWTNLKAELGLDLVVNPGKPDIFFMHQIIFKIHKQQRRGNRYEFKSRVFPTNII